MLKIPRSLMTKIRQVRQEVSASILEMNGRYRKITSTSEVDSRNSENKPGYKSGEIFFVEIFQVYDPLINIWTKLYFCTFLSVTTLSQWLTWPKAPFKEVPFMRIWLEVCRWDFAYVQVSNISASRFMHVNESKTTYILSCYPRLSWVPSGTLGSWFTLWRK